jgi:outer membrane protein assembly factor BamB
MDRARGRILHMVLHDGTLFVQTDQAVIHALHAETGQTLWTEQTGSAMHPTLRAGASSDYVAVVNGSTLYVLNRFNGKLLWKTRLQQAPGAGAALSERFAYVPMVNGMVYAYRLEPARKPDEQSSEEKAVATAAGAEPAPAELSPGEEKIAEEQRREGIRISQEKVPPLVCTSFGQALVQPLVTRQAPTLDTVAWTTSRGMLFVGEVDEEGDQFASRYHLVTNGPITSQPAYLPADANIVGDSGVIFGASEDGFVYAIRETDGLIVWRFSTGEPIIEQSVVVGLRVYVPTQTEGMYCLDAKTGQEVWWAPNVRRFIAASRDRVYTADKIGRMIVLNAATGARVDTLDLVHLPIQMTNDRTDRIYVASPTGLIQCLHEIGLSEPVFHRQEIVAQQKQAAEAKAPADAGKAGEQPAGQQPAAAENPFGAAPAGGATENPFAPAANQANPFDAGAMQPAGQDEDPFGQPQNNAAGAGAADDDDDPFN